MAEKSYADHAGFRKDDIVIVTASPCLRARLNSGTNASIKVCVPNGTTGVIELNRSESADGFHWWYINWQGRNQNPCGVGLCKGWSAERDSNGDKLLDLVKPDLIISEIDLTDDSVQQEEEIEFTVTIRNQGEGNAGESHVGYYINDINGDPKDYNQVDEIGGDGIERIHDVTLDTDNLEPGEYTIVVRADYREEVEETNERNNTRSEIFTVSAVPDLVIQSTWVNDDSPSLLDNILTPRQSFMLSVIVLNRGSGSAASTILRYYQSDDQIVNTNDTQVGMEDSVSSLSADDTSTKNMQLMAPSNRGRYYYGACVRSVPGESNTDNNCSVDTEEVLVVRNICSRTQQVRDAIQEKLQKSDCRDVTVNELRDITGTLEIDREGIRTLDENDFDDLTSLEVLELDFNLLTNLPDNIFNDLSSLTELFLHNNELVNLQTGVFDGLTNLTFLDLDGNNLTNLQMGAFDGLTNLTVIELRRNTSLTSVQTGVFNSLTSLMRLELSENGLTMLPSGVFGGLIALTNLDLKDNNLTMLPSGVFNGLTALTDLDLEDNNLAMLPTGVFDEVLDTLSDLDIDNTLRGTVSIEPRTASIMPGTVQTLTAQLTGTLPSTMRLTVTKTGDITAPTTVTIPAGMTSATFDITLATETAAGSTGTVTLNTPVLLYIDASSNTQENIEPDVVFSLVNPLDTATNTFTFITANDNIRLRIRTFLEGALQ